MMHQTYWCLIQSSTFREQLLLLTTHFLSGTLMKISGQHNSVLVHACSSSSRNYFENSVDSLSHWIYSGNNPYHSLLIVSREKRT